MKIGEKFFEQDGKIVHKRTFDPTPTLERLQRARETQATPLSDSVHVGTVPGWLVTEWLKEAGVKWDDPAANDVIKRKLMDGDFAALRNWTGKY